ncbi:MAG: hypothetical protein R3C25_09240 [Hyphomonadaceae bacterium]
MRPFLPSRRTALAATLSAITATGWPLAAMAQARRWSIAGAASTGSSGWDNPYNVLGETAVQELAAAALDGPLTRADVDRRLSGTGITVQNLIATDVLRRLPNGRYALAFNVVPREDKLLARSVADGAGASLAAAFLAEQAAFGAAFARYDLPHVDRGVLAMALVGCVVLDWDGLGVTASDGWRASPQRKPNGDVFQMTMSEISPDVSVRALYWGSHNTATEDGATVLSTFGDHEAPNRLGFPDVTSRVSTNDMQAYAPSDVARALANALNSGMRAQQDEVGRIMMRLREGPATPEELGAERTTQRLLEGLLYVRNESGRYHAHVPVISAAHDAAMVEEVRAHGRAIMRAWLGQNYARVREQLSGLRSVRAGVPYEIVFTQLWHDLFGWTNYHLVREGFMYDPYGPDAEWVSFVPFVWEASLNLWEGTGLF